MEIMIIFMNLLRRLIKRTCTVVIINKITNGWGGRGTGRRNDPNNVCTCE
jgi:hypothetical protein